MRIDRCSMIAAGVLCLLGTAGMASGATFFTEDFSDNSASPNMSLGTPFGTPTTDFTGDFTINEPSNLSDGERIYLGTNDTDYSAVDFIFEAEVTYPSVYTGGGNAAWGWGFFGMGSADASAGNFEPDTTNRLATMFAASSGTLYSKDLGVQGTQVTGLTGLLGSTHLVRLTWDSTTKMGLFEFDLGNNGSIDESFTIDGSNNGFDATNSQLYLGGGRGITWDNISVTVVPEPNSMTILVLACLGITIGVRRRRR